MLEFSWFFVSPCRPDTFLFQSAGVSRAGARTGLQLPGHGDMQGFNSSSPAWLSHVDDTPSLVETETAHKQLLFLEWSSPECIESFFGVAAQICATHALQARSRCAQMERVALHCAKPLANHAPPGRITRGGACVQALATEQHWRNPKSKGRRLE